MLLSRLACRAEYCPAAAAAPSPLRAPRCTALRSWASTTLCPTTLSRTRPRRWTSTSQCWRRWSGAAGRGKHVCACVRVGELGRAVWQRAQRVKGKRAHGWRSVVVSWPGPGQHMSRGLGGGWRLPSRLSWVLTACCALLAWPQSRPGCQAERHQGAAGPHAVQREGHGEAGGCCFGWWWALDGRKETARSVLPKCCERLALRWHAVHCRWGCSAAARRLGWRWPSLCSRRWASSSLQTGLSLPAAGS